MFAVKCNYGHLFPSEPISRCRLSFNGLFYNNLRASPQVHVTSHGCWVANQCLLSSPYRHHLNLGVSDDHWLFYLFWGRFSNRGPGLVSWNRLVWFCFAYTLSFHQWWIHASLLKWLWPVIHRLRRMYAEGKLMWWRQSLGSATRSSMCYTFFQRIQVSLWPVLSFK